MMATTALLCAFSIAPYIYLNLGSNNLNTSTTLEWVFPVLRATGGFTLIQLFIQRRIATLSDQYLVKRNPPLNRNVDVESQAGDTKKHQMDTRTCQWLLQFLLLIGLVGSVVPVGYVSAWFRIRHRTPVPLVGSAWKLGFL
jgi:hypothetical protein